jgi:CRP-like cAMP-binding protein
VCGRLTELALTHGDPVDGGVLIRDAVSQQELADWAGMSRDGVVRALQELRAGGLVSTGRREIFVRDLAALRTRAGM